MYIPLYINVSTVSCLFSSYLAIILQIGVSFSPPEVLGFQPVLTDAETKFSKEPLHTYITTSVIQGLYKQSTTYCLAKGDSAKNSGSLEYNKKNRFQVTGLFFHSILAIKYYLFRHLSFDAAM